MAAGTLYANKLSKGLKSPGEPWCKRCSVCHSCPLLPPLAVGTGSVLASLSQKATPVRKNGEDVTRLHLLSFHVLLGDGNRGVCAVLDGGLWYVLEQGEAGQARGLRQRGRVSRGRGHRVVWGCSQLLHVLPACPSEDRAVPSPAAAPLLPGSSRHDPLGGLRGASGPAQDLEGLVAYGAAPK